MKRKENRVLILSILGTLLLLSIAIAGSYAYFVANVTGNPSTNNVVVTNGVMSLEYKDGDEINLANAVPGNSVSKTFTVKNTGNVATNYTIYFSELSNKFVDKTDLVYTLTSSDGGKNVAQTQVPSKNDAMVSNYAIDAGKTHTYILTITFLNKDENQNDNMNVSFTTKIGINKSVEYVEPIEILGKKITDTTQIATDDLDNNIRYIGANPNNYVYFNCSDYSNQSDSTCEKWRIIGVFKNMTKEDGSKADLVKIIRDDILGDFAWDYTSSGSYLNDWSSGTLQKLLNSGAYYNATTGTYYNGSTTATNVDFTSTGLKNDSTRNAIESVVWNLGGLGSSSNTTSTFYSLERGTTVYSGRPTTWTGKIGLMYPSDYGYATAGGTTTNRATCMSTVLYSWNESGVSDCKNNDYLFKSAYTQWTLAPRSSYSYGAFGVNSAGSVYAGSGSVSRTDAVRPVAYLKSDILLSGVGDGSSTSPYQFLLTDSFS